MASPDAVRREHWLKIDLEEKIAGLRAEQSFAANWLEDFRKSLAVILGLEPDKAFELPAFAAGIHLMLETVAQMEEDHLLPVIGQLVYEQSALEWSGHDASVLMQRELNFAASLKSLHGILEFFSKTLDGLPLENEGGRIHCYNELMRLFRMRRLSKK